MENKSFDVETVHIFTQYKETVIKCVNKSGCDVRGRRAAAARQAEILEGPLIKSH